jgi:hypothetical protein
MSDIMNHGRSDLVELPCDTEPAYVSPYLQRPVRTLEQARRDLHARLLQSVRALDGDTRVVDMAQARAERRRR